MTKLLERLLERIDAGAVVGIVMPVIFVSFVSSVGAETPTATATVDGRIWHRQAGETEEAFRGRVIDEARDAQSGCLKLVFLG